MIPEAHSLGLSLSFFIPETHEIGRALPTSTLFVGLAFPHEPCALLPVLPFTVEKAAARRLDQVVLSSSDGTTCPW